MIAIIAVPYFDTVENNRASTATIPTLAALRTLVPPPHVVVPVDNGSTDKTATNWARRKGYAGTLTVLPEPLSIAEGVNSGWHRYHDLLASGEAVAVKHDSDLILPYRGWPDAFIDILSRNPEIGMLGAVVPTIDYDNKRRFKRNDHGDWWEAGFIFGALTMRSPEAFKTIGYMRTPKGRYGWDDHYDCARIAKMGRKLGVAADFRWAGLALNSCLDREGKDVYGGKAAMAELATEIKRGERPLYEPFKGYVPDRDALP